jgi:Ankyrin repeats (many copies)/Ankyrin repeat
MICSIIAIINKKYLLIMTIRVSDYIFSQICEETDRLSDFAKKATHEVYSALVLSLFYERRHELSPHLIERAIAILPSSQWETKEAIALFSILDTGDLENFLSLLESACAAGNLALVQRLLTSCNDTPAIYKALQCASRCGHAKIVHFLIEHTQVDVNLKHGAFEMTPLHEASQYGHEHVATLLLNHGAEVNARNSSLETPLHIASQRGHLEVVRLLCNRGAHLNAEDFFGNTPLDLVFVENQELLLMGQIDQNPIRQFLLSRGAQSNIVNEHFN